MKRSLKKRIIRKCELLKLNYKKNLLPSFKVRAGDHEVILDLEQMRKLKKNVDFLLRDYDRQKSGT
jgi:hypothetical protein